MIDYEKNGWYNFKSLFGKEEYSKDEINTAMGFLIDKSKGLKFEDKYLKPFTNEAPQQDYFTATNLQFYNNSYDPSNEFFESDTLATKLYAINNPYKYSHYSRNKFNKVSQQELDIISKGLLNHSDTIKLLQDKNNKDIKIKIGDWEVYPKDKSIYHQMGDKKNRNNVKLVNNDGREIVVRLTNDKYTIIDDNLNVGTYNYSNPNGGLNTFMHSIADVLPYYIYGNTPYDGLKYGDRVITTIEGLKNDF
ncbi:hypothetical protein, partial [Campylobacter ureolyticus]